MVEVPTASPGATTAGGTVSWVKYFEKDDHLGMHHVYYHQQYHHPQLGRALRVFGTGVALHFGPDRVLRRVNLAQVNDVPPLPAVALTTPQQAFAAAQLGLASWPGFRLGDPARWPPGTLASTLDRSELMLEAPRGAGSHRLLWKLPTYDADLVPFTALVDAATASLVGVTGSNPHACPDNPTCRVHCSPGIDPLPGPTSVPAKARPENPDLQTYCGQQYIGCGADGYRNVDANPFSDSRYQERSCNGICTYEAVRAAVPAYPGNPGIPQIEVYHGVGANESVLHCTWPNYGNYMRVGLMPVVDNKPTYDSAVYPPPPPSLKGPCSGGVDWNYRTYAGDAMFYTLQTMEVFRDAFQRCGFDGACGTARAVVAACGATTAAQYMFESNLAAPLDGVAFYKPDLTQGYRSMSSALDIVAHEWGHGVSKSSPANFFRGCLENWQQGNHEPCEMSEGFADVVGHIVEHKKQPLEDDGTWEPEHWDWTMGEDWAGGQYSDRVRRADLYDSRECGGADAYRYSVHAEDPACEPNPDRPGVVEHGHGNRLSVVLKLMSGPTALHTPNHNPAYGVPNLPFPCTGCDLDVTPLDPNDPDASFGMAAEILFRVLDTEADLTTLDWDDLPFLARNAAFDLYHSNLAQARTVDAFRAVGYPEGSAPPCLIYATPCCAPDWECLGEPE